MQDSQHIAGATTPTALKHPVAKGWFVHCFTATGAICGMFGVIAVADGQPREAMLWLAVAMILDGVDGPAARAWCVRENVPRIDGYTLDLIIDFVNCIVIPVVFLHQFHMLSGTWSLVLGAFVLFMSALWMSRTDQMSDDHFFNGFPCEWNMIVPTMYLLKMPPWAVGLLCVVLALTQLTNINFPHPMQVVRFRPVTVTVTVLWLAVLLWMIAEAPHHRPEIGEVLLVLCPLYIFGIGIWRTLTGDSRITAAQRHLTPA